MRSTVVIGFLAAVAAGCGICAGQVRVVTLENTVGCGSSGIWVTVISRDRSTAGGAIWWDGHGSATSAAVWDLSTGLATTPGCHNGWITSLSANGQVAGLSERLEFAMGGGVWDRVAQTVELLDDPIHIAISGDGQRRVESNAFTNQTTLRDRASGAVIAVVPGLAGLTNHTGDVVWTTSHALSPTGGLTQMPLGMDKDLFFLRTMSSDGRVFGGGVLRDPPMQTQGLLSVDDETLVTSGTYLVSSSDRGLVRVTTTSFSWFGNYFIQTPRDGVLPAREFIAREAPGIPQNATNYRLVAVSPDGRGMVVNAVRSQTPGFDMTLYVEFDGSYLCDSIDFNRNQVFPEDQDVVDFFAVLAGADCPTCNDIDFNNNGVFPEDEDVIAFFRVLAGGACTP